MTSSKSISLQVQSNITTTAPLNVPNLLRLPDELLVQVAQRSDETERQASLCNLSLVNRRLSAVFKEELYCAPSLKPDHAHQLVVQLLDQPRLAQKVTKLEILDTSPEKVQTRAWDWDRKEWNDVEFQGGDIFNPSDATLKLAFKCWDALSSRGIVDHSWRWIAGLQAGDSYAYVSVLLAITPKLKRLTVSNQYAKALAKPRFTLHETLGISLRPYMVYSLNKIAPSIEEFQLAPNPYGQLGLVEHNASDIDFWSFKSLDLRGMTSVRHLTFPSSALGGLSQIAGFVSPRFPPNLHSLRITDCQLIAICFLKAFLFRAPQRHPRLRVIEAAFREERIGLVTGSESMNREAEMQIVSKTAKAQGLKVRWNFQGRSVTWCEDV
ncbi:hypothetical protein P153DRAFT_362698 [Dothidotthia symphoricarpi CBS 119687]|uniref:F-box domain-containing protein n=1 Tax=Dothidotthia symphoricarpi CBS 119687 TaxID=1392245 RepID=A0A6A6AUX7_9PLEO|nr:uncharacterized protein P153DRAFT_362698 [Dothidotthia symphoricarpi CBS 119687]KAF2134998.1 hypothetical protein P153DRAFT_362698 [Dothidotthia symphoricarpi CBS 119687]